MIFIDYSWVFAVWQWSVDLYRYRKMTAQKSSNKQNNAKTIQKHRIHKTENKNTKQNTNVKVILKHISRVIRK